MNQEVMHEMSSYDQERPHGQEIMESVSDLPMQGEIYKTTTQTALFDRNVFLEMRELSEFIAAGATVPKTLRGESIHETAANILPVLDFARANGLNPLSTLQCAAIVHGRVSYEGKLIHALLMKNGVDLEFEFEGEGKVTKVKVIGRSRTGKEVSIEGGFDEWATTTSGGEFNQTWLKNPKGMCVYRGTRQWAREHRPDLMLGVYTIDEMQEVALIDAAERAKDITPERKPLTVQDLQKGKEGFDPETIDQEINDTRDSSGLHDAEQQANANTTTEDAAPQTEAGDDDPLPTIGAGGGTGDSPTTPVSDPAPPENLLPPYDEYKFTEDETDTMFRYGRFVHKLITENRPAADLAKDLKQQSGVWSNDFKSDSMKECGTRIYSDAILHLKGEITADECLAGWSIMVGDEL